jgi:hypothetical protein
VERETNYFYSQEADGIMGLSKEGGHSEIEIPIFTAMYEEGVISEESFNLCLGKDGGYFQIGGYDETQYLEEI